MYINMNVFSYPESFMTNFYSYIILLLKSNVYAMKYQISQTFSLEKPH